MPHPFDKEDKSFQIGRPLRFCCRRSLPFHFACWPCAPCMACILSSGKGGDARGLTAIESSRAGLSSAATRLELRAPAAEAPFVIAGFPPCSFWIKNARVSTYPACTGEHASRGRKPSLFWRGRKSLPQGKQGGSGGICQVCVPKGSTKQRAVPSKRPLHWIQLRITLTENADIHTTPFCQVKPPESRQPGNLSVIILRETQNVK